MHVALTVGTAVLKFYPPNDTPPAGVALPWLLDLGNLREQARAPNLSGFGAGELPTLECGFDNTDGQVADLIGLPLRRPLELWDDGELLFSGVLAAVKNGLIYAVTAQS